MTSCFKSIIHYLGAVEWPLKHLLLQPKSVVEREEGRKARAVDRRKVRIADHRNNRRLDHWENCVPCGSGTLR